SNAIGYQDDEVTITVSLGKNTAVAAYSATLVYDETALQLVSMTKGDFCTSVNVNNGIAVGFDSYNVTSGTLFSATFKILAKEGDYEVGVTFDDACLEDQTTVNMNVIPGIISIQCAHEDLSEIKYDEANHWYECETIGCGNLVNVAPHEGGTATCTSKATCSVCGYAYGSVNTANHTGGTEVRGYIAADCGNAGYTGDTYCNGCGVKTKTGSTIPATGAHTGGQATCCSKAKCSVCGNIYGAIIANNHAGGTEVRNASETYTGDTYCLGCGVIIAKGNTIKTNDDIVEMTVGTINGVISAGEEIAIPVNISKWANAYAILELKFDYDETLLKLNSINQSEFNGFSSASNIDTGMFSLVCNPSNEEKANKLLGGEVCVAYFTATKDITVSTPIRVTANVSGYANGKNDNWTETKKLNVSIKNGGIHIEYFNVEGYTSDLIVPFDYPTNSYTNYTSEANSYISIENSEKTEGDGSLYWKFGKPTGQSSNVAGTVFYNTSMPMNLSIYNRFCFDIYIPKSMDGSGGILQVNFISDLAGQEGYNYFTSIADLNAGWNTITFTKASWNDHLSNADFSSIYRIRLVWINASQINREFFLLDNFRGIIDNTSSSDTTTNIGHTPYTTENGDLMINNADSLDGWNSKGRFNTSLEMGAQHIEGFGSVSMESIIPKDQVQNIGAMTMLTFPTTDLSSYDKFRFKVHLSHNLTDVHQFQVNFISGNSDDGFNHVFTFANFAAGWVEFIIDRESIPMAVDADWTSIHSIRFTWFNHSQISTQVSFTIDEIMAIDDASHECSNTGVIYPDVTDHWYFCKTFGCDSRLERAPHEGGEATCCEKAICDVCDAEYGDFDTTNHVGGTEI
ncbi:MAG: hypothetical protein IKT35_00830, partial [Clostridia bacterium]|nr:hypothetical protein [Clostridia bacterium]